MSDTISILRHSTNVLAKRWRADGSIEPYADAKYFSLQELELGGIADLSRLLTLLESQPRACVIRGRYVGDERAAQLDAEHKAGKVRRTLDVFEDVPRHWCLIEVDNFEPLGADPLVDPVGAIDEFLATCLPDFAGSSFHWQLSNSAGSTKAAGKLKAHLWFWLEHPLTGAALREWAPPAIDKAVFSAVQIHYTAAPVLDEGVMDPLAGAPRSGFVEGLAGDTVPPSALEGLGGAGGAGEGQGQGSSPKARVARSQRLERAAAADPFARLLLERGLVKGQGKKGELLIECPRRAHHTGDSTESSTVYYPAHTGGFERGAVVCLHAHCQGVAQSMFHVELGYDEIENDFEDLDKAGGNVAGATQTPATRKIPEAKHLTTDQANVQRLLRKFGKRMVVIADRWHCWTGTHWKDEDGEASRYALHLSKIIHEEAAQWDAKPASSADEAQKNATIAAALRKWAAKSENKATIDAALSLAKRLLKLPDEQVDASPWLLNCRNGTVDLRTGQIKEHDPEDYITRLIELEYDAGAQAPLWEETLSQITREEDRRTKPMADFLRRWFGYCATGSTREQVFVVHWGGGKNGKSTVLDTVAEVLGDYAGVAPPGIMVEARNERHPTEIAALRGRRMVTAHETSENAVLREGFIKQATGSDKLSGRYMHGNFFNFVPTHKLQLLTNHKPAVRGQDDGIWRRVMLVPYMAKFGDPEEIAAGKATHLRDRKIAEALVSERQGILSWLVAGAIEWFSDGLRPPDSVLAASKDYQTEQDRTLQFIGDRCELGADYECVLADLYTEYLIWCRENGIFAKLSRAKLMDELERVVPHFAKRLGKQRSGGKQRDAVFLRGLQISASSEDLAQ